MDHLDFEGVLSASSPSSWILPAFDQQDAIFLSSSRQILEPIMEETSEDEENQNWSQYDHVWSSESDTGSVIRIELHNDQDSISERDYACPAKRPRRDDLLIIEETPQIRKFPRNENLLNAEINENYRKRFDELYSDSDTLSYNSLSRSSSLIQFESLERQLQNDLSSIGNSTPSLVGMENDGKGSESCLRRFESSDGRLHQTYFDLDKIDFTNDLIFDTDGYKKHTKSDSESSDNSILSHEERVIRAKTIINNDQRSAFKGKNSVENLSEDSGYCEHTTVLRIKSKSIPNFLRANDKFCEEEEFENHKSLEMIYKANRHDNTITLHSRNQNSSPKTKIETQQEHEEETHQDWYNEGNIFNVCEVDVKNKVHTNKAMASLSFPPPSSLLVSSSSSTSTTSSLSPSYHSSSLPDVRSQFDHEFDATKTNDRLSSSSGNRYLSDLDGEQFPTKSQSVPEKLDYFAKKKAHRNGSNDDYIWNLRLPTFVRSRNRSPCMLSRSCGGKLAQKQPHNNINASYNNLTALDYSRGSYRTNFNMSDYSGNSKRNSREFELGKGNFLLDEISSHFDKNLSILSDREHDSDLISEFLKERKPTENDDVPKPPARRSNSNKEARKMPTIEKPQRNSDYYRTFDIDPTNLTTSYTESLESCNFDNTELSNTDLNLIADHSTPIKRSFVASTPNLTTFKNPRDDLINAELQVSSAHNSMNPIPNEKKLGILLTAGSRNSLGKGVSFCPIVSEISFREQSSEEGVESDSPELTEEGNQQNPKITDANVPTYNEQTNPKSEIINKSPPQSVISHETASERSSSASNESIVELCSTGPGNDIPITVEMFSNDLLNGAVMEKNSDCDCVSVNQVQEIKNNQKLIENEKMGNVEKKKSVSADTSYSARPMASDSNAKNTGTDLLSSKFKPKPDEKHHKNGFLSRFTGGFRFSLRRKKKSIQLDKNINNQTTTRIQSTAVPAQNSTNPKHAQDFIYIPLKDPHSTEQQNQNFSTSHTTNSTTERHLPLNGSRSIDNNHVLLGKPPLPKQPPRVVGMCEKNRAYHPQQQYHLVYNENDRHAPVIRSKSQPKEIDERFLDNERVYYQLNGTMNVNGSAANNYQVPSDGPSESGVNDTCRNKIGLIETNLDTHETIISGKTQSLMELGPQVRHPLTSQSGHNRNESKIIDGGVSSRRPHKSMEFLLDKENHRNVLPPENELQKSHDSTAALSEHQLRVQASLQRLNIPDWFRTYNTSTPAKPTETLFKPNTTFTRKRSSDSTRWAGLNSKTTSLTSLGLQRTDRSPLMLSPSAHSHHGQTGFTRWSTTQLNSNQTSPSGVTRGSFSRGGIVNSSFISGHSTSGASIRNSFRQPYLGWRSQEKLTQPRTPHERLASSLLPQQQQQKQESQSETPEIQSSIKEVTSAIVHYVNDQTNRTSRSRSTSPNSRKCWVESSFVGIRPVESPQTPNIENSFNRNATASGTSSTHSSEILRMNGVGESSII